jgi:hypothetical protein
MRTTVIIAERNEPDLSNTVSNIRANSDAEVLVMSDTSGVGCQQMRHRGIFKAKDSDIVIMMDGHMRVQPDTIAIMVDAVKDGKAIACAKCHHHHTITFDGEPYGGAYIAWKSSEPGNQHWVLPGKWRETSQSGRIGCVMGACYAMRRDWYLDGLKAPWRWGTGWGVDEEALSITNWLAGGEAYLTEAHVWHQARAQNTVPYQNTPLQNAGIWANRMRIIDMLPMCEPDRMEMIEWMKRNDLDGMTWSLVKRMLEASAAETSAYRRWMESQDRTWDDWKATWCNKQSEVTMNLMQARKRVLERRNDYTWKQLVKMNRAQIDALLTDKAEHVPRPVPDVLLPKPRKAPEPLITVRDTGTPCTHCGHRYDHRVTNTYPNHNRRVICGGKSGEGCGRPFIMFRT